MNKNSEKKQKNEKVPLRYWLVELTLTSGRVQTFYVKAINQFEANKTADYYAEIASNEKLSKMADTFRLMP